MNGDLGLYAVPADDPTLAPRVRRVLQALEEKVFAGPVKLFQVFRQFDRDGDGFVSYADFEAQLQALQVAASKQELTAVLQQLDPEGRGYLDYRAFAAGVHPHMSAQAPDPQSSELHLPNLAPNKAKALEYGLKSSALQQAVTEARRSFQPDPEQSKLLRFIVVAELVAPTRFSAKPPPPNTFLNFQPGHKTPGFISERERLLSKRADQNNALAFQQEDKQRKQQIAKARTESKRSNMDALLSKINEMEASKEAFHQNKIYKKAAV